MGQALLLAARKRLADWGVQVMKVSVVAGNEGANRFYRREGAMDFQQTFIMPVAGNRQADPGQVSAPGNGSAR